MAKMEKYASAKAMAKHEKSEPASSRKKELKFNIKDVVAGKSAKSQKEMGAKKAAMKKMGKKK
jgi:hypothetical protein